MLCDRSMREKLPFDVHHYTVIFYDGQTPSGFAKLEADIAAAVPAALIEAKKSRRAATTALAGEELDSLSSGQVEVLLAVNQGSLAFPGGASMAWVTNEMRAMPDAEIALHLRSLIGKEMVSQSKEEAQRGYGGDPEVYHCFKVSRVGEEWITKNAEAGGITFKSAKAHRSPPAGLELFLGDDSTPF